MAWTLVIIILVVFFAHAFAWILAFLPYTLWIFYGFFKAWLDLIKYNLYPVGNIPYLVVSWIIVFWIVYFVIKLIGKRN